MTESRELARRWTLRYLAASTVILLAAGLLGELIRSSQAGYGRIDPNWWYALMTAHGLGAFLGWAGFAVMGLSWWVLEEVGFPLRRFGALMAAASWWLMVVGVAGVLVSTLAMHFAGSWVFLYPLPFHSAGRWSDTATFVFSGSVLLVGLSIVTWCCGILQTTVSPALHAVSTRWTNRTGVALGLGYLWPKRFATNPRPVPYPVIPLTVIAIDMIVATLPLAVLLVEMMIQAYTPSVHVDPLLAKNVLWWFGHPVVYLLLFPAVAVYYYLVPRLAGRELVAGNVIAVAWGIAVIANVLVWAHHVYLDYPAGSVQGGINTAMQPMTYALVIPSALSLYSLAFTIFRSNYRWTAVGWALLLGMFSWFVAGLSGIVNATIAGDVDVHNTLWIVGHFHEMALINIGLLIFAGIYYWLPELVGRPIWSEALAKWHIWLTFVVATVHSFIWQWQGLEGAPRRWAVLPHQFEALNTPGVILAWGIGASQLLFVWNMVQTLRGAERRTRERAADVEAALAMILVLGLMLAAGVGGYFIGRGSRPAAPTASTSGSSSTSTSAAPAAAPGKAIFASAGCAACHTLKAAGATGTVGPNLDQRKPPKSLVVDRVTHGKRGMPSFAGRLTPQQIQQVAEFVSSSAGKT